MTAPVPRPPAREVVAVRVRPENRARITALAARRGEKPSATARMLLAYALDHMPAGYGQAGGRR